MSALKACYFGVGWIVGWCSCVCLILFVLVTVAVLAFFFPMQAPYVARVHQFDSTQCALLTLRACLIITHQYNRWYAGIQMLPKMCSLSSHPFPKNQKRRHLATSFVFHSAFGGKIRVQVFSLSLWRTLSEFWGVQDRRVGGGRQGSWIWNKGGRWRLAVITASLTVATASADEDIFRFSVCHRLSTQCLFFP